MERQLTPHAVPAAARARFCAVTCHRCRMEWAVDPALAEHCTRCSAEPGEPCWDGGRMRLIPHLTRDYTALASGRMPRCEGLTWDGRHARSAAITIS